MAQFKDDQGEVWSVRILPHLWEKVRKEHAIDLLDFQRTDPREKMLSNPMLLYAVIEILCADQAEELKLDRKQFHERMPVPPDPIVTAITDAIVEAHSSENAETIREMFLRYDELSAEARKQTRLNIQKVIDDPRTWKAIRKTIDDRFEEAMSRLERGA